MLTNFRGARHPVRAAGPPQGPSAAVCRRARPGVRRPSARRLMRRGIFRLTACRRAAIVASSQHK
ncbi:acetolactate synthase [Burkholderia thailandensis]|nr:acetolactate synthase [Burkholderia thailandensis]AVR23747.1 acetolactate synthase [Burkholderia thailandensis]AWY57128.1 acetolactate synthase [Burkholderia thailandensis]AWY68713.1 acetolactate synthase [Burkholderia thailandensis]MDD1481096.1 acetolactate synthase [Burkholderia thailandensis]